MRDLPEYCNVLVLRTDAGTLAADDVPVNGKKPIGRAVSKLKSIG